MADDLTPSDSHRRKLSFYVAVFWLAAFGVWTIWYVITWVLGWRDIPLAYHRLPSVVGIPFAMLAAFIIVTVLEQVSGPIELTAAGFTFKGAAGQVLFWLLVFMSIVYAIHLLWPLTVDSQSNY